MNNKYYITFLIRKLFSFHTKKNNFFLTPNKPNPNNNFLNSLRASKIPLLIKLIYVNTLSIKL